jgi:Cof subfamily protein (haloacid dehalogenase superfamily)
VKFRLIAIDLDGTLLSPRGDVTPRTREAVHMAVEAGLMVCFATGRNFTESMPILESVGHYDAAVFVGGAMVIDTRTGQTLQRTLMDAQLARELCAFFEGHGQAALALQDTSDAGVDYLISAGAEPNLSTQQWLKMTKASVRLRKDLATHPHMHTVRVAIVVPNEKSEIVQQELNEFFGDRIVSHNFTLSAHPARLLEVFDPAVSKWAGIMHVAGRHGIDPSQIIAVGDDVNDLPMVQHAGLGLAMGNAHPSLKAVAKRIIGHHSRDGLAEFLERLVARDLQDVETN